MYAAPVVANASVGAIAQSPMATSMVFIATRQSVAVCVKDNNRKPRRLPRNAANKPTATRVGPLR